MSNLTPPPDYLDSGHGVSLDEPRPPRSGVKRGIVAGGGLLGLALVGVGAWAAYGFLATGAQPAQAVPAGALGYVSIDLDPAGGQKIAALRTLNKFPAFKDAVGISSDEDLRKALFDSIQSEAKCDGLSYQDDVEPWLGDRAAVAAVKEADEVLPVVVLQVKDAAAADRGLKKLIACGESDESTGWAFDGDWAVITSSKSAAEQVIDDAETSSLADDATFKRWTEAAGEPGVATLYAAPAAGDFLADNAADLGTGYGALFDDPGSSAACAQAGQGSEACDVIDSDEYAAKGEQVLPPELRDFKGMAATLRFSDGALELESAGDGPLASRYLLGGGGAADVVATLPADTVAAFGLGFAADWFPDLIDQVAPSTGMSADQLTQMLSDTTGLALPDDAEKLAGDSAVLAVGKGFDPSKVFESQDGTGIPVALKIKGDPDDITSVIDKLVAAAGPLGGFIGAEAGEDAVVIGPDADYRAEVVKDGALGDDPVFKDVVREADKAGAVLFVNVDELQASIEGFLGSDEEFLDNLTPVSGVGFTSWVDGDVAHGVFRLTTD